MQGTEIWLFRQSPVLRILCNQNHCEEHMSTHFQYERRKRNFEQKRRFKYADIYCPMRQCPMLLHFKINILFSNDKKLTLYYVVYSFDQRRLGFSILIFLRFPCYRKFTKTRYEFPALYYSLFNISDPYGDCMALKILHSSLSALSVYYFVLKFQ